MSLNNKRFYYIFFIFLVVALFFLVKIDKRVKNLLHIANEVTLHGVSDNVSVNKIHETYAPLCDKSINRKEFFAMMPNLDKVAALEIAPYFRPILKGDNVKYFDVFDHDNLVKIAQKDPNIDKKTIKNIPETDYVHPTGDMSGIKEKFDIIFSSHNIEHQVNLLKHLNQVANLLKDEGQFFIAVPDKRYCFDHYIPETPLSEVLAIYWTDPATHSLQTVLSMRCETAHNKAVQHWRGDSGYDKYGADKDCYINAHKEFINAGGSYIDSHKWRFTPESFYRIVEESNKMGLQPLKVRKVFTTAKGKEEFFVILYKPSAIEK
ncbi:MAG: methyltransferase domain-containing protein [Rickettsiaceae bacterium]|nr:methyltransferase domain-containing protein [Rickettsiaceae bacterium]